MATGFCGLMTTREERWRAIDASVASVAKAGRALRSPATRDEGGEVFRTITVDDWRRQIARARAEGNAVWARIRAKLSSFAKASEDGAGCPEKILDVKMGKSTSEGVKENR